MKEFADIEENLTGTLLLSHPALLDPNFRRSVVLVSSHSRDEGAFGAIINRPKGVTLGELDSGFAIGSLAEIPVYEGGPVRTSEVILAGWQWLPESSIFKVHFGIDPEQAATLIEEEHFTLRAFLGYAGWGEGQLEDELRLRSWLVSPFDGELMNAADDACLWRRAIRRMGSTMRVLAEMPEDPSSN